jgi:hypothetical protein
LKSISVFQLTKLTRLVQDRYGQREIPFEEFDTIFVAPQTKKIKTTTTFDKQLKGLLSVPPEKKD